MLGVGALGAGVDGDDDDVCQLPRLPDHFPRGGEVGERSGVGIRSEAEEGHLAAIGLDDRGLARQSGLGDADAVQRCGRFVLPA